MFLFGFVTVFVGCVKPVLALWFLPFFIFRINIRSWKWIVSWDPPLIESNLGIGTILEPSIQSQSDWQIYDVNKKTKKTSILLELVAANWVSSIGFVEQSAKKSYQKQIKKLFLQQIANQSKNVISK